MSKQDQEWYVMACKQSTRMKEYIKELINYDSYESILPSASPHYDIAVSHLQLALFAINEEIMQYEMSQGM